MEGPGIYKLCTRYLSYVIYLRVRCLVYLLKVFEKPEKFLCILPRVNMINSNILQHLHLFSYETWESYNITEGKVKMLTDVVRVSLIISGRDIKNTHLSVLPRHRKLICQIYKSKNKIS